MLICSRPTYIFPLLLYGTLGYIFGYVCVLLYIFILTLLFYSLHIVFERHLLLKRNGKNTIGFFHPFADHNGGGERVLWCAIKTIQTYYPQKKIFIYTDPKCQPKDMCNLAFRNFNIKITPTFSIIPLKGRDRLHGSNYKRFTLIRQALASMYLGSVALLKFSPEVFIDTTGWAFIYPIAWILGTKVICYVHYPTISTDMIVRVKNRTTAYNNSSLISSSIVKSNLKFVYYHIFACWYAFSGIFPSIVIVNSSWTRNHIRSLWWRLSEPIILYPPVDINELSQLSLKKQLNQACLVSVGQFRPEKNHALQLRSYKLALTRASSSDAKTKRIIEGSCLKIVGSCRNEEDFARLSDLKHLCISIGIDKHVEFFENVSFGKLKEILSEALGGLHSMIDEHFGICIVEYMAAGIIPIAHNSGGPKEDIITPLSKNNDKFDDTVMGYLAETEEEYASAIYDVLIMDNEKRLMMTQRLRENSQRFSQNLFMERLADLLKIVFVK